MIFIINQYSTTGVYMKVILWKIGQIYVRNNYCDELSLFSLLLLHGTKSNKKEITILQISLKFVECYILNLVSREQALMKTNKIISLMSDRCP